MLPPPKTIPELLFYLSMGLAAASWLALFLFPRKHFVNWWLCGVLTPVVMSTTYCYLLVAYWDQPEGMTFLQTYAKRFSSLPGVQWMFENQGLLLVAWLDILAMDMIAGAWIARRAQKTGLNYPTLVFVLAMTFANAPPGMALYYAIEGYRNRFGLLVEADVPAA
ncbi:MAG: DUF4281 domain-containing protein [Acidobacteria bacterium]|nr:DUF4281 domain-containing protein [Acidobacteriota bacterium]MBV9478499.1 DUF4281 domain-containing protein [Acidobacteriota bacterium]